MDSKIVQLRLEGSTRGLKKVSSTKPSRAIFSNCIGSAFSRKHTYLLHTFTALSILWSSGNLAKGTFIGIGWKCNNYIFISDFVQRKIQVRAEIRRQWKSLDKNLLDFLLDGRDLGLDLRSFVLGDGRGDHGTRDAASAAESCQEKRHRGHSIVKVKQSNWTSSVHR